MSPLCFGCVVKCNVTSFYKAIESVDEMENHKVSGIPPGSLSMHISEIESSHPDVSYSVSFLAFLICSYCKMTFKFVLVFQVQLLISIRMSITASKKLLLHQHDLI